MLWESAVEPWHVLHSGTASVIDGDRVTFGGPDGWVHQFDLATGKPLRERKLDMGLVTSIVDLGGGRVLAIGFSNTDISSPPAAFTLDVTTLEPTPVVLPVRAIARGSLVFPRAIRIGDGVVISGAGLPLSIYEPKGLTVRSTLDNAIGWSSIGGRGEILLASRNNLVKRFDLGTNGQRDLGYGITSHLVTGEGADVYRVARNSKWIAEITRADKTKVELPDEIDGVYEYDGKHFLTTFKSELRIHELPSGEIKKRIKVGDSENFYQTGLVVSGKRAVVTWNGLVRLIDLESGLVAPKDASTRIGAWLAVGNDGVVLGGNDPLVWTMVDGKVTATEIFDLPIEMMRSDDPRRYVTGKTTDHTAKLEVRTIGDKAVRAFDVPAAVDLAYLARDGSLLLAVNDGDHKQILRTKDTSLVPLFRFNYDAEVVSADPDGDILVAVEGRVAVATQEGKSTSTLRIPHCEAIYQHAVVDPRSSRAVTYDSKDLALWDRKTGTLLASIKSSSFNEIAFIPKRDELVIVFDDRVVLWSPTKGTRTLRWSGVVEPAVSADGTKLALAFFDGRVGVYDLATLLAAPLQADFAAGDAIPETCGETDPLAVAKPESDSDDEPPLEQEDGD